MNNNKKNNSSLPLVIIGSVLLAALAGGWWLYSGSTSQTKNTKANANKTSANAAEIYSKAPPGANPPNYLGAPNAAVTVEEFADFQCGTCAAMHPKVQEIRAAYGDRVKIVFRQFPLTQIHQKSYDAASAVEAAGMQGKFWDMQNLLFSNQQNWVNAADHRKLFEEYAQRIGLNVAKFSDDMLGLQARSRVDKDLERGRSLNISQTPTFFINGNQVPDLSVEAMKKIIDAELQKAQGNNQPPTNTQNQTSNQNK